MINFVASSISHLSSFSISQHHCRHCGGVVCGPCSSKKFLLPQQSSKPVRVCLNCYDSLSQTKNEQVNKQHRASSAETANVIVIDFNTNLLFACSQAKTSTGNSKSNNNTTAESSGEDDSDDDEEQKETHDEVSIWRNCAEFRLFIQPVQPYCLQFQHLESIQNVFSAFIYEFYEQLVFV